MVPGVREVGDVARGAGHLMRGFRLVYSSGRLAVLGLLPAILTGLAFLAGLIFLLVRLSALVGWTTGFADDWADVPRVVFRVLAGIAIVFAALALGTMLFAAVTLAIGGPFYDRIADRVARDAGLAPPDGAEGTEGAEPDPGLDTGAEVADSLRMVLTSLVGAAALFAVGFVPVAGQLVVPVASVVLGAWLLTLELTGAVFSARGLGLAARRRALRRRRGLAVGFGVPAYALLAIPLIAIVAMPGVVAGGSLVACELLADRGSDKRSGTSEDRSDPRRTGRRSGADTRL